MALAERLDQVDFAGQMIRVIRADAMQFIQQFLGNQLGRGVLHAVDDTVPHSPDRLESILFEPINQKIRCRFVIGGGETAAVRLMPGRVSERQTRPAQADAINLSIEPSLQWFADLVQGKPDARRTAIDRQDGLHSVRFPL
jgi:hypothetical protein